MISILILRQKLVNRSQIALSSTAAETVLNALTPKKSRIPQTTTYAPQVRYRIVKPINTKTTRISVWSVMTIITWILMGLVLIDRIRIGQTVQLTKKMPTSVSLAILVTSSPTGFVLRTGRFL